MSTIDKFRVLIQNIELHPTKNNFVDLYLMLENHDLSTLITKLNNDDSRSSYSVTGILKALVYFDDAELQPMPRLHKDIEWEQVKKRMGEVVKGISLQG